jgi:hypothetical protein
VNYIEGVTDPPPHEEDRARAEFRLLTAEQARVRARARLQAWLEDHPQAFVTQRDPGRHRG